MKKHITIVSLFALFSNVASAHPGHGSETAYAGFMHPLTGWDHLLVMLAIGIWAARLGGKARWQLPLTFVSVMLLGAILGASGIYIAGVETAIAASLIVFGVLLMLSSPMNTALQLSITAIFALFHGMAHGVELQTSSMFLGLCGMLTATAMLHGIGLLIGSQKVLIPKWVNICFAWLMLCLGCFLQLS